MDQRAHETHEIERKSARSDASDENFLEFDFQVVKLRRPALCWLSARNDLELVLRQFAIIDESVLNGLVAVEWHHFLHCIEHDPEKWIPVFRKRSCSNKKTELDNDSKKSHRALEVVSRAMPWLAMAMTLQKEVRRRLVDDLGYDKRIERDFSGTGAG
jgi:hypothetical protein